MMKSLVLLLGVLLKFLFVDGISDFQLRRPENLTLYDWESLNESTNNFSSTMTGMTVSLFGAFGVKESFPYKDGTKHETITVRSANFLPSDYGKI